MTRPVVDVHTHCAPDGMVDRVVSGELVCPGLTMSRDGDAVQVVLRDAHGESGASRRFRLTRAHRDLPSRLAAMGRLGVDVQVVSPLPYLYGHGLDPKTGERWCRTVNEALAEMVALRADRFRYLAGLPMQDARLAARELERALAAGAAGVAVATRVGAVYLDDPAFAPFWEAADGSAAWVLLHPAVEGAVPAAMRPYYLTNLIGHPVEIALAAARLMLSGVLLAHPRVRVCLAHAGGALPLVVGRLERGSLVREEVPRLGSPVRELYRRLFFDTVTHDPDALAYLVRTVGASHVCLGSDAPADMGDPDPVGTVRRAPGLTDDERAEILSAPALLAGATR